MENQSEFSVQKGPGFESFDVSNFLRCVQRASMTAGLQPLRKALTTKPSALSPASSGNSSHWNCKCRDTNRKNPCETTQIATWTSKYYMYICIYHILIYIYYIIISYSIHIHSYHSLVPVEWCLSSMLNGIRKTFEDSMISRIPSRPRSPTHPLASLAPATWAKWW